MIGFNYIGLLHELRELRKGYLRGTERAPTRFTGY